ncbi:tetratricopeptide repeat protein [candidate division WOR-3 bacterium]|nr:tetratricopeptide repeat protein [candidate division WOR-3 bacterium]
MEMNKTLVCILAVSLITPLTAQEINTDSLRAVADSLHAVGDSVFELNQDSSALGIFRFELTLRREILDSSGELKTMNMIGRTFNALGEPDSALVYADMVLGFADVTSDSAEIGQAYHTRGYAFFQIRRYEEAIGEYNTAVDVRLACGDSIGAANSLYNIGLVYRELGEYGKALENHEKAMVINLKALGAENPHVAESYYNIGKVNHEQENPDSALAYYTKSIDIFEKSRGKLENRYKVFSGKDLDSSGQWDGDWNPRGLIDVEGDGFNELLISIGASMDLYPRGLAVIDPQTGKQLWFYEMGGKSE